MKFKSLPLEANFLKISLMMIVLSQVLGCAAVTQVGALVLEYPFAVVDIGGYIGTGKGTSEQALSQVTRKDCAYRYMFFDGVICKDAKTEMAGDQKSNKIKASVVRTPNSPPTSYPPKLKNEVKVNPNEIIPKHLDPRKNRGRRFIKRPWPPGS